MLPFRSLDPFRPLREPDRRRRDEERLSRSEQRTANKPKDHLTGKAPYRFESISLQRRVNELSVPLDERVFEPPDLLQTRMNGGDQIVVEADQILRRPRAISRPRARATEAKR